MIDRDSLVERCGGDVALVEELLSDFLDRCPAEAEKLRNSGENLHREAHRLKGLALNLSMPNLQELAAGVEERGHQGTATDADREELLRCLIETCRFVEELLEAKG
ncbi:MAG: Hpt domain-containing protein [Spirochaetaceae bacterium]